MRTQQIVAWSCGEQEVEIVIHSHGLDSQSKAPIDSTTLRTSSPHARASVSKWYNE